MELALGLVHLDDGINPSLEDTKTNDLVGKEVEEDKEEEDAEETKEVD
jgi:hypothetical protein